MNKTVIKKRMLPVLIIMTAALTLGGCLPNCCYPVSSPAIAIYQKDVSLNAINDDRFVKFLEDNTNKIVFINSEFDASVSTSSQQDIVDQCMLDHDSIDTGGYVGIPMNDTDGSISCANTIVFKLAPYESLQTSHGGTGLYYIQVGDFFEVKESFSGLRRIFNLKQYSASVELRAKYFK